MPETLEIEERYRSPLCEEGKHKECEHSSFIGICGCECHDILDQMDEDLYGVK